MNAVPYSYHKFPTKLNSSFCDPVRRPPVLVKEPETMRMNNQGSQTASMISNSLLHRRQSQQERAEGAGTVDNPDGAGGDIGGEMAMDAFLAEARRRNTVVGQCIVQLQAVARMRRQRKVFQARFVELKRLLDMAALKRRIFAFVRMVVCRMHFRKCRYAAKKIGCAFRRHVQLDRFRCTLRCIVIIQRVFRRHHCYLSQLRRNQNIVAAVRGHLGHMWALAGVSLIDRSRFWYFFGALATPTYLSLVRGPTAAKCPYPRFHCHYLSAALHVAEFNRMFAMLGWSAREAGNSAAAGSYAHFASRVVYANTNSSSASVRAGSVAAVEAERSELYKIMKAHMDSDSALKGGLFTAFGLGVTKKRKQALSQALWADPAPAAQDVAKMSDISARITMRIEATRASKVFIASAATGEPPADSCLARLLKAVEATRPVGGGEVTVTVTPGDRHWLTDVYGARVSRACCESACLSLLAMSSSISATQRLASSERELAHLKEAVRRAATFAASRKSIRRNTGSINLKRVSYSNSAYPDALPEKDKDGDENSPLVANARKLVRRASRYNI